MKTALSLITAASDRGLLPLEDLRAAAGVTGNGEDARLQKAGVAVADTIARWCGVAQAGISPPTLRRETLEQTFWPAQCHMQLVMARRFVGTISVIEKGVSLPAEEFSLDAAAGLLLRLRGGEPCEWACGAIKVTYQAGFEEVPTDLAQVASEMVSRRLGTARDPMLKRRRVDVPGVEEVEEEFWVDANAAVDITPDMAAVLLAYRTPVFG